jgi:hypothetical protein
VYFLLMNLGTHPLRLVSKVTPLLDQARHNGGNRLP